MGKKKQTDDKRRRNVSTSTHKQLLAHKIGHRYHLLISRRAQQQKINRNESEQSEANEQVKKNKKLPKKQSQIVKSASSQQHYSRVIKDDKVPAIHNLHAVRRSERLASLERTRMVDNSNLDNLDKDNEDGNKDEVELVHSLPELESTINLDHAYSKQLDCKGKVISLSYEENTTKERKSNGKQRKSIEEDRKSYWSTENGNFCDRFATRSRSPSAGSSSSCSSTTSNSKPVFNSKSRKALMCHRRGHPIGSKVDKKNLKRRKSKPNFMKLTEKARNDDENEVKRRRKVLSIKRGKEVQEIKQGSKSRVENVEGGTVDSRKMLSTRRRGRPPKMQVGTSKNWTDESEQTQNVKSSKWAALSHEQQCAAIKGWKYLLQVAFTEIQLASFWDEVEKDFFRVQVRYIRHQNQNDWPVDEEYLTVLRNTVVWKHLRCHHETILKQLRRKLQELTWRHAEIRSTIPNSDRHPTMRKQMELLHCIESILSGGTSDVDLNGSCHRVPSSSLTEILQTIEELENVEDGDVTLDQTDCKMLDDILNKLQLPYSPVTVMPLGGETVAVPLPVNDELCDSLLQESHLTCLPPDVVEAYLQIPNCGASENPLFCKSHLSLPLL